MKSGRTLSRPVAVIDIGSNSGRVVVYQVDRAGHLRILASARAPLRLVRDAGTDHVLGEPAIERTLNALEDFLAVASGSGARRTLAVATSAVRDAVDGPRLISRARRELRLTLETIDGEEEARFGLLGAVYGLPVRHGWVFDLGGGSLQISRFRNRRRVRSASLRLGALRLSERFLVNDPPRPGEVRRLKEHVHGKLRKLGLGALEPDEDLVGTGGTVRNLAKIDRRGLAYPIERLHGYTLSRARVHESATFLTEQHLERREAVPGLSDERADSIVGGAVAIEALVEALDASQILVSGQGVREGVAYSLVSPRLPSIKAVREASIDALTSRFAGWDSRRARRRARLAANLARRLLHDDPEVAAVLAHAATVLDVGRSIEFFDRHHHVADIVVATEMNGFSHREIALLAAILRSAGTGSEDLEEYRPLVKQRDHRAVSQAGVLLSLADEIDERIAPARDARMTLRVESSRVVARVQGLIAWRERGTVKRFKRAFGKTLVVRPEIR